MQTQHRSPSDETINRVTRLYTHAERSQRIFTLKRLQSISDCSVNFGNTQNNPECTKSVSLGNVEFDNVQKENTKALKLK